MRTLSIYITLLLAVTLAACNHDVFVEPALPENPDPGPDKPEEPDEPTGELILESGEYDLATLASDPADVYTFESKSTFFNHDSEGRMTILYDNYNASLIRISNSTYYVTPWATEQIDIPVPGLDAEGTPGFYGAQIPFKFGTTVLPYQFKKGEKESMLLPADTKVTATVTTLRRAVTVKGKIVYIDTNIPSYPQESEIEVTVMQPIDIIVEWSDIEPI